MMRYGFKPYRCLPMIPTWMRIGARNPWISQAWDPEFDRESFAEVGSLSELKDALTHGNWSTGVAFCLEHAGHFWCFINQVNGGDEWLVIRNGLAFESVTARAAWPTLDAIRDSFYRWTNATDDQLKRLEF